MRKKCVHGESCGSGKMKYGVWMRAGGSKLVGNMGREKGVEGRWAAGTDHGNFKEEERRADSLKQGKGGPSLLEIQADGLGSGEVGDGGRSVEAPKMDVASVDSLSPVLMDVEIESHQEGDHIAQIVVGEDVLPQPKGVDKENLTQGKKPIRKVQIKKPKAQRDPRTPLMPICENKGSILDGGKRKLDLVAAENENQEGYEGSVKKKKIEVGDSGITTTGVVETDHTGSPKWI